MVFQHRFTSSVDIIYILCEIQSGFVLLRLVSGGFCENVYEPVFSSKYRVFFDQINEWQKTCSIRLFHNCS
jgi:hypothetical protein